MRFESGFQPETLPHKEASKRSALKRINEAAKTLFVVGAAALTFGAGEGRAQKVETPDMDFNQKMARQWDRLRQLESKEAWAKSTFGKWYPTRAEGIRLHLQNIEAGAKQNPALAVAEQAVDQYLGPAETAETEPTAISDIEGVEGTLPAHILRQILNETYPKGWVNSQVSRVEQRLELSAAEKAQEEAALKEYGVASGQVSFAKAETKGGKVEVTLLPDSKKMPLRHIVNDFVAHEALGHGNDWETDNDIVPEQAADLIHDVDERLDAPDRVRDKYLDQIHDPNDPAKERYFRAKEYYAITTAAYFDHADELAQADFEMVDRQVRQSDAKFDWKVARARREELINQALKTQNNATGNPRRGR